MTGTDESARTGSIEVDQFVDAAPARVWQTITEPELLARWWAPGDIAPRVGHRFHLDMPGWGAVPCEVLEVVEPERLVHTFNGTWTLTWQLVPEGRGTRLLLQHRLRPRAGAGPARARPDGPRLAGRRPAAPGRGRGGAPGLTGTAPPAPDTRQRRDEWGRRVPRGTAGSAQCRPGTAPGRGIGR